VIAAIRAAPWRKKHKNTFKLLNINQSQQHLALQLILAWTFRPAVRLLSQEVAVTVAVTVAGPCSAVLLVTGQCLGQFVW
jgi:hypothetical protein